MVIVPKPKGGTRICVDLTHLNRQIRRPVYPTTPPRDAVSSIHSGCKFFTTVDAKNGYWQIPLDESSQELTTFMTPWGRYKFLRAPMGLSSTGDEYCRRYDGALADIEDLQKVMDDVIIYSDNYEDHKEKVKKFLDKCRENKITLNPEKFTYGKEEVQFVGFKIDKNGTRIDDKKIRAISDFPTPKSVTQLKSFLGLANQFGDFTDQISKHASPLRDLLKKNVKFQWLPEHESSFQNLKKILSSVPVLKYFDPKKETILQTDASKNNGLGFALLQKHDNNWSIIQCGSRFLTDTESRYAVVELELLAVVWALQKCRNYLLGLRKFELQVDHRPLLPILDKKTLEQIENPRLQRLKEKTLRYNFSTTWIQGSKHAIPDALSRSPCDQKEEEDQGKHQEININAILRNSGLNDPNITKIIETSAKDIEYQDLLSYVKNGFPSSRNALPPHIKPYWNIHPYLSIEENLILFNQRIVIPKDQRKEILQTLHSSHQGMVKTKRRARMTVYWPAINSDIENITESCWKCQENQPSNRKEPMITEPAPTRVFEQVSIDYFFTGGSAFLVYVDKLSNWPVIHKFRKNDISARTLIQSLRKNFMDLGVPVKIRSDCGRQFSSQEFKTFLERWGVQLVQSTPYNPQSNGLAEATVKNMKALILKTCDNGDIDSEDFQKALLEYRNTPGENGLSPAQMLFGQQMRTLLPAHRRSFSTKWTDATEEFDRRYAANKNRSKTYYDRGSHPLKPLPIKSKVFIQDCLSNKWNKVGEIIQIGKYRDYLVKTPAGNVYWRNRKFLRPLPE